MRVSTAQIFDSGVLGMQTNQSALYKIQNQLSTGRRILTPEDDPAGAAQALLVSQSKEVNTQYIENQGVARSSLNYLESNLKSVGDELQNILERAIQGGNASLSAEDRKLVATEIESRFENLLNLANAQDGTGKYLYSGFQSQVKPFEINSIIPNALPPLAPRTAAYDLLTNSSVRYAGDDGNKKLQVSGSVDMETTAAGSDVFMRIQDSAGNSTRRSVFDAVNNLINYLKKSPGTATSTPTHAELQIAYDQSLNDLQSSLGNVLKVRSSVGARLNQLDGLDNVSQDYNLQYKQRLSELQDVDYVKAISDLSRHKMQLEAAQASFSKISNMSLFDYI